MIYSKINKIKDFFKFDIHRAFRTQLINYISKNSTSDLYDYGEGYFYQSLEKINLSGLRNSKKRIEQYDINSLLLNKDILDIGCNSGFLLFQLKENYNKIVGIDHNSSLIDLANMTCEYLKQKQISFVKGNFMKYDFTQKFNVIFSFANHTTFDKGIKNSEEYFDKCFNLLLPKGYLFIESHHPNYENQKEFNKMIDFIIKKHDLVFVKKHLIKSKYFYDDGRTFVVISKK